MYVCMYVCKLVLYIKLAKISIKIQTTQVLATHKGNFPKPISKPRSPMLLLDEPKNVQKDHKTCLFHSDNNKKAKIDNKKTIRRLRPLRKESHVNGLERDISMEGVVESSQGSSITGVGCKAPLSLGSCATQSG
jgi:hypothetical protein